LRAKERQEARRRGGINRLSKLDSRSPRQEVSISSVSDVMELLEAAAADILQDRPSQARAKSLAYISMAALKALEVGDLEERVEALEQLAQETTPNPRVRRIS
jgi:hypothetical protein